MVFEFTPTGLSVFNNKENYYKHHKKLNIKLLHKIKTSIHVLTKIILS